jgi:CxxC-x17-CxxC domain-containing protein
MVYKPPIIAEIKCLKPQGFQAIYVRRTIKMPGFNNRGGGFPKRDFGPREMHKATCSECGKECEVPFKPTEGKPVYCKECYMKKKRF